MFIVTRKSIFILFLSLLLAPWITFASAQNEDQAESTPLVFIDDRLETDISSMTPYTFNDQSTLTMSEDTIIRIDNHNQSPGQSFRETIITVSYGWVRFKGIRGMKNNTSFKIVTPSATAGGRESEFSTIVDSEGKTTFIVMEGQIATLPNVSRANEGNPFLISAGEAQDFYPDGSHSTVRRLLRNF